MASTSDLFLQSLAWKLTSEDDGTVIEGQWAPSNHTHDMSAEYSAERTLGRSQPILQYDGDTLEKMKFQAHVRAMHQGVLGAGQETIEDLVEKIKGTVRKTELGRPHVYVFESGDSISFTCVVKSIGGIVYDRMRPLDGTLRGVTFDIELWRYEPYDANMTGSAAESLVLPLRENESFEGLAARVYGDPTVGEALRRRNPDKLVPTPGDLVHLPPKAMLVRGFSREQQTPVLRGNDEKSRAVVQHFLSRHRAYRSHTLGREWDGK